jgi:hypothetical protein
VSATKQFPFNIIDCCTTIERSVPIGEVVSVVKTDHGERKRAEFSNHQTRHVAEQSFETDGATMIKAGMRDLARLSSRGSAKTSRIPTIMFSGQCCAHDSLATVLTEPALVRSFRSRTSCIDKKPYLSRSRELAGLR